MRGLEIAMGNRKRGARDGGKGRDAGLCGQAASGHFPAAASGRRYPARPGPRRGAPAPAPALGGA